MGRDKCTMSDRLFDLCEMQLLSIIAEAEASILKVTNSTAQALKISTDLSSEIKNTSSLASARGEEIELCSSLENSFNGILVNMQFFDEFSQRIEHIREIVDLIKLESDREGFLSNVNDSTKLFNDIKDIFSIRSEFEVMKNIFPEYETVDTSESVELF